MAPQMREIERAVGRDESRSRLIRFGIVLLTLCIPAQVIATEVSDRPPIAMTIPLPEPLFWDPVEATGEYTIVEQTAGIFIMRPVTGRVIAHLRPSLSGSAKPLEQGGSDTPTAVTTLASPDGWPFLPGDDVTTTPVVTDLDRNGTAEIIFATLSGWVWAVGGDGLPPAGWPVALESNCHSSPALSDLDSDGRPEILVGDDDGKVHALRWDGIPLNDWPAKIPGSPMLPAIYGAVVSGDLDRDGSNEVVVCQAEGRVCVFHADGRVAEGWPVATADGADPPNSGTIFSRPAIGDLDGDGDLEVIAAANNYRVHVWDSRGRPLHGWPRSLRNHGRAGYAEPVLADLTGDGKPEILIPTDRGFKGPPRIYALGVDGRSAKGWPVDLPRRCNAGVAVGDLDGDDLPEVVAATVGDNGWVLAFDREGNRLPGFPVGLAWMSANSSPLLTDIDGDGSTDIFLAASGTRFEPAAVLIAINNRGRPVAPFPFRLEGREVVESGPTVADIDNDGLLELLLGTEVQGELLAWNLDSSVAAGNTHWSRPGFDSANTGLYRSGGALETIFSLPPRDEPVPQSPTSESPFSPLVSVTFVLQMESQVRLIVRDVQGNTIRTLLETVLPIGSYTVSWDGTDDGGLARSPGIYFYELDTPERCATGQFLLLR